MIAEEKISLILAESALETVPAGLESHPSVVAHARRVGGRPSELLLDNSWHYAAMRGIDCESKRGRPDLVHIAVVTAAASPIYQRQHRLDLYVHTICDDVIHFGPGVRIPKSYHRFAGLVEKLYRDGRIAADVSQKRQDTLLELKRNQTVRQLLEEKKFSRVVGLSSRGAAPSSAFPYAEIVQKTPDNAAIVVGGFQKGQFSDDVSVCLDETCSVGPHPLEAHVVIARLLYEYEKKPFI